MGRHELNQKCVKTCKYQKISHINLINKKKSEISTGPKSVNTVG